MILSLHLRKRWYLFRYMIILKSIIFSSQLLENWEMDYFTSIEMSKVWGISSRRVSLLCSEGRVPGAEKKGKTWLIPKDAKKPENPRQRKKQGGTRLCTRSACLNSRDHKIICSRAGQKELTSPLYTSHGKPLITEKLTYSIRSRYICLCCYL